MTVKLEGFKELDKLLGQLPRATAGNVLSRVLIKAAEPMREEMARLAPDDPKTGYPDLHTSIFAKKEKGSRFDTVFRRTIAVGVFATPQKNPKTGKEGGLWYYSKAFELGLGDMPLRPYVRPAFDTKQGETIDALAGLLKVEIDKAVARRAKKGL